MWIGSLYITVCVNMRLCLGVVIPEVEILVSPSSLRAVGQGVNLSCVVVRAHPSSVLSYEWTFPDEPNASFNGSDLVVSSLTADDFGNYSCVVSNVAGSGFANLTLRQACKFNGIRK